MNGYFGRLLRVDLSNQETMIEDLDPKMLEKYVGGVSIGAKILYEETTTETDPLGPDNILVAMAGPFTGTSVPSSSRHHIMAPSPQTGIFGEANVGGSWAVHFKKCGYDGIAVTGKADQPVYLWIHDGGVKIRDTRPIWGKDSYDSAAFLKSETTDKATVAVIGPAGANVIVV